METGSNKGQRERNFYGMGVVIFLFKIELRYMIL
jgi:hypothetical protein